MKVVFRNLLRICLNDDLFIFFNENIRFFWQKRQKQLIFGRKQMLSNLNVYRSFYQLHQCRTKANQIKLTIHLIIRLTLNQSQLFCDCLLNMCTRWIFLKTMSHDKFHHSQLFHESKKKSLNSQRWFDVYHTNCLLFRRFSSSVYICALIKLQCTTLFERSTRKKKNYHHQ